MTPLLEIEDLHARVGDKEIIKGFNLTINEGEVHAVMGPNGAGKSTLSYVLTGKPGYEITSGSVRFKGKDLTAMSTEERAREGIFLCMQYPVEIPGVPTATFLKHAVNAVRKHQNLPEMDTFEFLKLVREEGQNLGIGNEMIKRPVNVGFSGGEKKRMEMFQMAVLEPSLCMVDEMDSGLDVDALKTVAEAINVMRSPERSFMLISHNRGFLESVGVDKVHVLVKGKVVETGGRDFLERLESFAEYREEE